MIFEKNIFDVIFDYKNQFVEAKNTMNSNLIKIVTYTNNKRILLNQKVRDLIFRNPAEYEVGEIIIFNDNFEKGNTTIENAEEFPVIEVTPKSFSVFGTEFQGYNLMSVKDNGKLFEYPVIAKSEKVRFNKLVEKMFNDAKRAKGTPAYKAMLVGAWEAKNYFANIDYAYVITSHKAQGSTYHTTMVDESDILSVTPTSNQSKSQSIYTAITRSSNTTIVVNDANPNSNFNETLQDVIPEYTAQINPEVALETNIKLSGRGVNLENNNDVAILEDNGRPYLS